MSYNRKIKSVCLLILMLLTFSIPINSVASINNPSNSYVLIRSSSSLTLGKLGIIVIFDALNVSNLELVNTPNIDYLISNGKAFLDATTVLPSATTSAHAAMVTGAPPEINGVVHTYAYNATEYHESLIDEPISSYGYMDMLRVKTLPEVVKESGGKVALIISKSKLQLMAGQSKSADKIIILPNDIIGAGDPHEPSYPLEKRFECMEWITNETLKTIEEFYQFIAMGSSALIIAHYAEPDWIQGALGTRHPDTLQLIEFLDEQLGRILNKLNELNLWSRTLLVLAADHGFVDVDEKKNLLSYDYTHLNAIHKEHIISETAGLLLYIYLKDPNDTQSVVNELWNYPWTYHIWTRYPSENTNGTLADIGLNIDYAGDIVLDIKPPYYASRYSGVGAHGGTATQKIPIIFAGGLLKSTTIEEKVTIMHIGPTMAKFFGTTLPNASYAPLDLIAPMADISLGVYPGIAEPGSSILVEMNYTISEAISSANATVIVYDVNGSKIYEDSTVISNINGSIEFSFVIIEEGSYTIYGILKDNEGKLLGGKTVSLLVIATEKPPYPWGKVLGALLITLIFSGILIVFPYYWRERKIESS